MTSTLVWIAWMALFGVLEAIGLQSQTDRSYTLTNRIRALMRVHPIVAWSVRGALFAGLVWLWLHLGVHSPQDSGAFVRHL